MKMIDRLTAYRRQNEAAGRARPDELSPRQRRRAEKKRRRADKRVAERDARLLQTATYAVEVAKTDPVEPYLVRADEEPPAVEELAPAPCPRCGAAGDAPCTTPSGATAAKPHKGRA